MIFLDMDGVLVDFVKGVKDKFGLKTWPKGTYDISKILGISRNDFYNQLDGDFYENLEPLPNMKKIAHMGDCILSAPVYQQKENRILASSIEGKVNWIRKHLPEYWKTRAFLIGSRKEFCAKDNILIDDYKKNIKIWENWGGHGILVPAEWNTVEGNVLGVIHDSLERITNL